MAELQLVVRYQTRLTRAGFYSVVALAPVWSLGAPALFGMFLGYTLQHPNVAPTAVIVTLALVLMSITVGGILCAALFEDDRINVSKDGLSIPLILMGMRMRRNFFWSELASATLIDSRAGKAQLVLTFNNAMPIVLSTSAIKREELEQLLMAIELWANRCQRAPELIAYQSELRNDSKGKGLVSYTQMWEEELGRRFSNTSFVPLEPGQSLQKGRLKVVRQLAFGGYSAIYLAQINKLELVVLKEAVVPPSVNADLRNIAEEHLAREAKLLATLSHPQIAKVLDCFTEEGRHYMLLEHISGQDLRQYVKQNGPQPEALVREWARQLAGIVQYLHAQSPPVIHRDLTPDNIVLRNDGTLILIDFGASNQFVGTATGTMIGKQSYISPEQLRGKAVPQSDLYALGGTLNFLLTGQEPVPLMVAHPAKTVESVSPEFDQLIANCTALDVEDRVASAEQLASLLDALPDLDESRQEGKAPEAVQA
jgi:serine/threonine protein kinase